MTRIVKNPNERRKELIETALKLFQTQGYSATTVEAIIQKTGVAKGTFYHYFKSKKDILEAVVTNILDKIVEEVRKVSSSPSMNAMEKLKLLLGERSQSYSEAEEMIENLHLPENKELHERINVETVLQLSPILTEVIKQGVKEGIFHVENILETVQFLLTGWQFLFDLGFFNWSQKELIERSKAMEAVIERSLGAEKGTFSFLNEKINLED